MKPQSRYLIRGIMDGLISTLGVVIGAFNPDAAIVVAAGAAGAVANGVSNIMAALTAEYAERYQDLRKLEQATLSDLSGTHHEKQLRRRMRLDAAADGLASISGGVIPLVPFFFLRGPMALYGSIAVSCSLMGILGVWVGALTKQNMALMFIKLVIMTVVTAFICFVIGNLIQGGTFL